MRWLEARPKIDFALWAAGAVGSHSPAKSDERSVEEYARAVVAPLSAQADAVPITSFPRELY